MAHDRIILWAKVSDVRDLVTRLPRPRRALATTRCTWGSPRPGFGAKGIVASTAGLSILVQEGIGDTIRVSLTPTPGGDRAEEVRICQQVLSVATGLRHFTPQVTSCPGCGRTTSTFFQELAAQVAAHGIQQRMATVAPIPSRRGGRCASP